MNWNKSLIKTLKRNGPNIEPWGTPLFNYFQELRWFEIFTRCLRPFKKSSIVSNAASKKHGREVWQQAVMQAVESFR